jgi:hypothetical protein
MVVLLEIETAVAPLFPADKHRKCYTKIRGTTQKSWGFSLWQSGRLIFRTDRSRAANAAQSITSCPPVAAQRDPQPRESGKQLDDGDSQGLAR